MKFGQAVASGWKNFSNSRDRASRSEYWYWTLFTFLVGSGLGFVQGIFVVTSGANSVGVEGLKVVAGLFNLAVLVPSIRLAARRLHDTGRSGWWFLIGFTIVGLIPLVIWYCLPGKPGTNKYGPNPLEPGIENVF
jgi:uncharacterized membrane protein YhaH (DUF805 family)